MITAKGLDDIENKVYGRVVFNQHYTTAKTVAVKVKETAKMQEEPKMASVVTLGSAKNRPKRRVRGVQPSIELKHSDESPNGYSKKSQDH